MAFENLDLSIIWKVYFEQLKQINYVCACTCLFLSPFKFLKLFDNIIIIN